MLIDIRHLKNTLFIIIAATQLQGCVGAAFVAGAAASGAIVSDKRSLSSINADQEINRLAQLKLDADLNIAKNCHIVHTSYNRILLVAGQTPTDNLRKQVLQHMQEIPNVKRIYNEITLTEPSTTLVRSSDSWITTKVKSELLMTKSLPSRQIKVLTENGVVYLMGLVTQDQADTAVNVVRAIQGVQKVVKLFEYVSVIN